MHGRNYVIWLHMMGVSKELSDHVNLKLHNKSIKTFKKQHTVFILGKINSDLCINGPFGYTEMFMRNENFQKQSL